jgi:amino acid transporter
LVILFNSWYIFLDGALTATDFLIGYITIPIFAGFYLFWKLFHKTRLVPLMALDFETGRRELDAISAAEEAKYEAPSTWYMKVWAAVM